jgi:hypothetical protein
LGVGATPTSKLHVRSDANALTVIGQIQNRDAGASTGGVIAFINSANDLADNRYAYLGALTSGAGQNGNNLVFATNANGGAATEKFRFGTAGQFGIGGANYGTAGQVLTSGGSGAAPSWAASGPQANGTIYENSLVISSNYTLTAGKNGMSVGPITINSGVAVTVPSGQRWIIF